MTAHHPHFELLERSVIPGVGLVLAGIALTGYALFQLTSGYLTEQWDRAALARQLAASHNSIIHPAPATPASEPRALGILDIPRLDLSVVIRPTAGNDDLDSGAGWIPGTARPGYPGNTAIAAHRDTFFRPLRHIRKGDTITLRTPYGDHTYAVTNTKIVNPSDVSVLEPTSRSMLTLVTCYPFDFVGPAPRRFIVQASAIYRSPAHTFSSRSTNPSTGPSPRTSSTRSSTSTVSVAAR